MTDDTNKRWYKKRLTWIVAAFAALTALVLGVVLSVSTGGDSGPSKAERTRVLIDAAWEAYEPSEQHLLCASLELLGDKEAAAEIRRGAERDASQVADQIDYSVAVDVLHKKCETL